MSFEDLVADEPLVTVYRPPFPSTMDASALAVGGAPVSTGRQVVGRVRGDSGNQIQAWLSLGIEANATFYTNDEGIYNGDYLYLEDGRLFRVVGTRDKKYHKGRINTFFHYPLKAETQT